MSGSSQPAVSVVIPTRNRSSIVQRAVHSALNQTFSDIEVIVVIDGADSATSETLRNIADVRLRTVALSESVGGSEARNIGIRAARAEWVALLDDDDEWMPEKLQKQMVLAQTSSYQYPIVATALIARSPLADFRWPRKPPVYPLSEYLFVRNSLFQGEGLLQTSTWLTKRQLLLDVPFTRGLRRHQDWDWILRAANAPGAGVEFVNEALAIWYIDDPRSSIKTQYDWRYSMDWIRANRGLVTPRAYAGLMAVTLSSQAAWQRDWKAFWPLLRETLVGGSPTLMDLTLFFAMWFVPRKIRHEVRSLMARERSSQAMPATVVSAPKQPEPEF
jgi:glycosyltransferase involved in cell wall biosynthesis